MFRWVRQAPRIGMLKQLLIIWYYFDREHVFDNRYKSIHPTFYEEALFAYSAAFSPAMRPLFRANPMVLPGRIKT